jgi:putative transposase
MAQKKLTSSSVEDRRRMIEPQHPELPITRQCELLGLARASYYHQPEPESDENLRLMRVIGPAAQPDREPAESGSGAY